MMTKKQRYREMEPVSMRRKVDNNCLYCHEFYAMEIGTPTNVIDLSVMLGDAGADPDSKEIVKLGD